MPISLLLQNVPLTAVACAKPSYCAVTVALAFQPGTYEKFSAKAKSAS